MDDHHSDDELILLDSDGREDESGVEVETPNEFRDDDSDYSINEGDLFPAVARRQANRERFDQVLLPFQPENFEHNVFGNITMRAHLSFEPYVPRVVNEQEVPENRFPGPGESLLGAQNSVPNLVDDDLLDIEEGVNGQEESTIQFPKSNEGESEGVARSIYPDFGDSEPASDSCLHSFKKNHQTIRKWLAIGVAVITAILLLLLLTIGSGWIVFPTTPVLPTLLSELIKNLMIDQKNATNIFMDEYGPIVCFEDRRSNSFECRKYDFELLEMQKKSEVFIMPSVMSQLSCTKTKWANNAICCFDGTIGDRCAIKLDSQWELLPDVFYRTEFLKKNDEYYIVAQTAHNIMPILINPQKERMPLQIHGCGGSHIVKRFDVSTDGISVVFQESSGDHSLLWIDPFQENRHECKKRIDRRLGELYGVWRYKDLVWYYRCTTRMDCLVEVRQMKNLHVVYDYKIGKDPKEQQLGWISEPQIVGKVEDNYLNIYTFVNHPHSTESRSEIKGRKFSFPNNNLK